MSIWAIADLHASHTDPTTGLPSKPMDVFGERWTDHMVRLDGAWRSFVLPDDTVVIPGDIDWAMYLDDAMETLRYLDSLPGRKIILRGNHDYWWSSKSTARVRRALPSTIHALHNDSAQVEGLNICGTKGSPVPGAIEWGDRDGKLLHRECERLKLSLATRDLLLPTIVALHYPPFYSTRPDSVYRQILEEAGVACCIFGHLHGSDSDRSPRGPIGNVDYRLVAADALDFRPLFIARNGSIVPRSDVEQPIDALRSIT